MKNTKLVYGNCLLGAIYLCLRLGKRAKKVGFISSHAWWIPAHVVVETKRHNILHFKYAYDLMNPLYFVGSFEAVRSSEIYDYLQREERSVVAVMEPKKFIWLGILCVLMLIIPWTLYWPMEVLLWKAPRDLFGILKRKLMKK